MNFHKLAIDCGLISDSILLLNAPDTSDHSDYCETRFPSHLGQ